MEFLVTVDSEKAYLWTLNEQFIFIYKTEKIELRLSKLWALNSSVDSTGLNYPEWWFTLTWIS